MEKRMPLVVRLQLVFGITVMIVGLLITFYQEDYIINELGKSMSIIASLIVLKNCFK